MIATIRVWRRQGGSIGVYIVAGAIVVALMLLAWAWDTAAAKRAQAAEEQDEADTEVEAGAFPVPPMDLPHYHGIGVTPGGSATGPPPATDAAATKEVTGA
jgi:NADH-quinone oxidoreductase subunit H